ncbi:hypothetical protein PtB15_14B104 [Puccinia triticina]|nr:hypothetical protein PtB15_14B104 [Puccinia triticina]
MTPPTPVNFKRPSPLVLVAPDSDFPLTITPPGLKAFDISGKPASVISGKPASVISGKPASALPSRGLILISA